MSETRAIYEPWKPKVGDQVRIRLSSECPYFSFPHGLIGDGHEGRVLMLADIPRDPSSGQVSAFLATHPVAVEVSLPSGATLGWFAAAELEPLKETDNA